MTKVVTTFPERFQCITEWAAEFHQIHFLSREDYDPGTRVEADASGWTEEFDYCDFYVRLKDGRAFGFSANTPEGLRAQLNRSRALSLVGPGILVVSELTLEALFEALEEALSSAYLYGLEHFGYRCDGGEEASKVTLQQS